MFVFPSLNEGFGLPVLEAMGRGLPVVTSDRSALPEVAGDAALLVDPESVEAIAAATVRAITDAPTRERLIAAGPRAARRLHVGPRGRGDGRLLGARPRVTAIGLDLVFLAPGATGGMETYARALVPELARRRPGTRWVAFCGRELAAELRAAPWCEGLEVAELPVSSDTRVRRVVAEQTLLVRAQRRAGVELVHALGNTAALAPGGPPLVLTIHDLIWRRLPETHTGLLAKGLAFLVPRAARRAAASSPPRAQPRRTSSVSWAWAPSASTSFPGPGAESPTATPEDELRGGSDSATARSCCARRRAGRTRTSAGSWPRRPGSARPWWCPATPRSRSPTRGAPTPATSGWVDGADMEGLYRAATLLAFPSLAEGFGLPVLEAMRRGLPVACSNTTALPEVAGDAALTFDPLDEGAIRAAVERLLGDGALREELARRGREQAARFSWEAAAEGTWAAYDSVLQRAAERGS